MGDITQILWSVLELYAVLPLETGLQGAHIAGYALPLAGAAERHTTATDRAIVVRFRLGAASNCPQACGFGHVWVVAGFVSTGVRVVRQGGGLQAAPRVSMRG